MIEQLLRGPHRELLRLSSQDSGTEFSMQLLEQRASPQLAPPLPEVSWDTPTRLQRLPNISSYMERPLGVPTSGDSSKELVSTRRKTQVSQMARRDQFFSTPLISLRYRKITNVITKSHPTAPRTTLEEEIDYFFYPSAIFRKLGISQGVWVHTKATAGWQYTIQPFNLVSEDSPIFEFCRKGDVAGIQTLLKLGQASVWDRDPRGRTPLWVSFIYLS